MGLKPWLIDGSLPLAGVEVGASNLTNSYALVALELIN